MYQDCKSLTLPDKEKPFLAEIRPNNGVYRKTFENGITAKKISFFYTEEHRKPLRDISFLQVKAGVSFRGEIEKVSLQLTTPVPAPTKIEDAIGLRFGEGNTIYAMEEMGGSGIILEKNKPLHLISPEQKPDLGIAAVNFDFEVAEVLENTVITLSVQDVVDPRREAMGIDVVIQEAGKYKVTLDIPDQVFLPALANRKNSPRLEGEISPPPVVWCSFVSEKDVALAGVTVTLHKIPRDKALKEAGYWRKFLLKGLVQSMSEPRPWCLLNNKAPVRKQIENSKAIARYSLSLLEVMENAEIARLILPEDKLVKEYHDWLYQTVDRKKPESTPKLTIGPNDPYWAVLVRENWRELNDIARWWLDNRMVKNGEFVGGVGDDTDLFQVFQCLPFIESSPLGDELKKSAAQISDLCIKHKLEQGMSKMHTDALHAYEEGINQLALCTQWFYGDPVHLERAMISAYSVTKLLYETKDGRLHFGDRDLSIKNVINGYDDIKESPGDGNWHPARYMFHPLYFVLLYNKNPYLLERFSKWADTWAGYQKPGHFVGKVDINTGNPVIVTSESEPKSCGPVREWLALYQITGDKKWQKPCEMLIGGGGYWGSHPAYGRCTYPLFDWDMPYQEKMKKFNKPKDGYAAFFVKKDRGLLYKRLNDSLAWLQRTRYMNTAAEPKTDRVILYNASVPICCYLGDSPNRNVWLDLKAVSYEGMKGEDFAALVWDAGRDRLKVAIYNFKDEVLAGKLRLWRLEHGKYQIKTGLDIDDNGSMDEIISSATDDLHVYSYIPLNLPVQQVLIVEITQTEKLDDIRDRADLALSPIDTKLEDGGKVCVIVHNIGGKAAKDIKVVLKRKQVTVAEKTIAEIAAPLDLKAKISQVEFDSALPGDVIIVDPENLIPEITEHNNSLELARVQN